MLYVIRTGYKTCTHGSTVTAFRPQEQHCSKIMKPPQSLPIQMAERLLRAQPDSVANHVTARSIGDWRALTWLATDSNETGWARRKRSAICSGKLISVYMIPYDVNRRYDIYRVAQKWHSFWYTLTSSNINRFSKLFNCHNREKMCNKTITKAPTTP